MPPVLEGIPKGPSSQKPTPNPSPGSPTAAQDEVLLLRGPLGARAWQSEAERGFLGGKGEWGK